MSPVVSSIQTNILKLYGSKLVGKTFLECPEQCPRLDAQLPRYNLCPPGGAESVLGSMREYIYHLFGVLSLVFLHNRSLKPLSTHRVNKTRLYRSLFFEEGDV